MKSVMPRFVWVCIWAVIVWALIGIAIGINATPRSYNNLALDLITGKSER